VVETPTVGLLILLMAMATLWSVQGLPAAALGWSAMSSRDAMLVTLMGVGLLALIGPLLVTAWLPGIGRVLAIIVWLIVQVIGGLAMIVGLIGCQTIVVRLVGPDRSVLSSAGTTAPAHAGWPILAPLVEQGSAVIRLSGEQPFLAIMVALGGVSAVFLSHASLTTLTRR